MTVRDLGYRPYEGDRLAPGHNTVVMLRHGVRRAWASILVKIAVFAGWLPAIVAVIATLGVYYLAARSGPDAEGGSGLDAATTLRALVGWQIWLALAMITLGAGASTIAEDLRLRAFQFYFAKPVTLEQYLAGRMGAVALWCFALLFGPLLLTLVAIVGTAPPGEWVGRVGLALPALFIALITSVSMGSLSVAVSALSTSRALTTSAWVVLLVVPHVLSAIVTSLADWPWLSLLSLPAVLGLLADALFKIEPQTAVRWYHALLVLCAAEVGALVLVRRRLAGAEVVT
jgi:hypothetical protein